VECKEKTKVFAKGETIYLNFDSDVENLTIDANLMLPDGTKMPILFPYSFKAEQLGTYVLEVKASKEGYRSAEQTIQFGVIGGEPEIKEAEEKRVEFEVRTCRDEKCGVAAKEFLVGEKAYVNIESKVSGINVKAIVTLPDGTKRELALPGSIELSQKGSYIIEATAEKAGWKKTTKITEIEVKSALEKPGEEEKPMVDVILLFGGVAIVALALLIIIIFFFIRRK
jgi:hypothetical protein